MAEEPKKKGPPVVMLPPFKYPMPMLGLGTYKVTDEASLTQLLRRGLQMGYAKHIDTARMYNNEIALGKAIKTVIQEGRCTREDLFIATKTANHVTLDPVTELKEALTMMQLQYVDLYYVHWPASDMIGDECMHHELSALWARMEECVRKGYARHLGISNFNGQLLNDLLTYAKIKPVALQIEVHPYYQQISLVELAQSRNIHVLAHTPLARGDSTLREDYNILKDDLILDLAAKYSRTPAQIVLRSTLMRGVGVIPKTSNPERLQQNWQSWTFDIAEEDLKKIKAITKMNRICDGKSLFTQIALLD